MKEKRWETLDCQRMIQPVPVARASINYTVTVDNPAWKCDNTRPDPCNIC